MVRLLSGVALAAAALAAVLYLPILGLRILASLVAARAAWEFMGVTGSRHISNPRLIVVVAALVCWRVSTDPQNVLPVALIGLALVVIEVLFKGWSLHEAATDLVGVFYVALPLGLLVALHDRHGWRATLLLVGAVVVSDSAQYYSGRAFGRRPLAPAISPKKTVEGAMGGLIIGTAFMVIAGPWALPAMGRLPLSAIGFAVVVFGICGDLFESRLKRAAGVKDSSALIPGHGGVLDRIDALLFAAPAFYLFLQAAA
jgi:phosphatidate cytidylyltransferase